MYFRFGINSKQTDQYSLKWTYINGLLNTISSMVLVGYIKYTLCGTNSVYVWQCEVKMGDGEKSKHQLVSKRNELCNSSRWREMEKVHQKSDWTILE